MGGGGEECPLSSRKRTVPFMNFGSVKYQRLTSIVQGSDIGDNKLLSDLSSTRIKSEAYVVLSLAI